MSQEPIPAPRRTSSDLVRKGSGGASTLHPMRRIESEGDLARSTTSRSEFASASQIHVHQPSDRVRTNPWLDEYAQAPVQRTRSQLRRGVDAEQIAAEEEETRLRKFVPYKKVPKFDDRQRDRMGGYESIDYWEPQSYIYRDHLEKTSPFKRWFKWLVFMAVGLIVGLWAFLLFQCIEYFQELKVKTVERVLDHSREGKNIAAAWGFWVLWSFTVALVGSLVCIFTPSSAGSGVPEVMAYLNGVSFPQFFNSKNLFVKTFSCLCAVNSGLPVGSEGPMIHIGALLGAGLPSGRSRMLGCSMDQFFTTFRNSKDHRDFITAGAAAGVSAAFSSPIGGLLFVMEEVATYFPVKLAVRVFFCCLSCVFSLQLMNSYFHNFELRHRDPSLEELDFVEKAVVIFFSRDNARQVAMNVLTIIPAVLLGIVMGVLSVIFTHVNLWFIRFRNRYIAPRTWLRVLEPSLVCILFGSIGFFLAVAFDCEEIPMSFLAEHGEGQRLDNIHLHTGFCEHPRQFNPMATLTLTSSANVLKLLYSRHTDDLIGLGYLSIFFVLYFGFAMYSSGMFISSGVIIPTLMIGCIGGRFFGVLFEVHWAEAGVLALVGSAAFFGGLSRLTFSLAVIMIEISGSMQHILLFMIAITFSKSIADKLSPGLYEGQLAIKCVPFLAFDTQTPKLDKFQAGDIMSKPVVAIYSVEKISKIIEMLEVTTHNGFPVKSMQDDTFKGIITRHDLQLLLWHNYLCDRGDMDPNKRVTYSDILKVQDIVYWAKAPPVPPIEGASRTKELNLNPLMDCSAFSVQECMSISRTYNMFRALAIRHLVVVSRKNHIVGMITRKELVTTLMFDRLALAGDRTPDDILRKQSMSPRAMREMLSPNTATEPTAERPNSARTRNPIDIVTRNGMMNEPVYDPFDRPNHGQEHLDIELPAIRVESTRSSPASAATPPADHVRAKTKTPT